jgi:hypothetical protein
VLHSHVPNPGYIENILRMDAESAKEEHDRALTQFLELSSLHAHTRCRPQEIEESSRRLRFAREAQTVATKRLKEFVVDGTVPNY